MLYHLFRYLDEVYDLPGSGMFQYISFRAACGPAAAYQAEQEVFRAKAAEDFKRVEVAMGYKRESRLRNAKRRTSLERRRRK